MRHVFDHRQLAHVWAQQSQDDGRTSNGSLFFSGRTIYSYGHHFPIATFHPKKSLVFFCNASYSNTTNKHQRYVYGAVDTLATVVYVPTSQLMRNVTDWLEREEYQEETKDYLLKQIQAHYETKMGYLKLSLSKRRTAETKRRDVMDLIFELNHYEQLLDALDSNLGFYPLTTTREELTGLVDNLQGEVEELQRKEKEKLAKAIEEYLEVHQDWVFNYWMERKRGVWTKEQADNYNRLKKACKGHEQVDTFLRYNPTNETIETTRGATFPLSHALGVFNVLIILKRFGRTYKREDHQPAYRLGHFTVDSVNENGDVKAGCHFVKWNAIELCAHQLIKAGHLPADCLDVLQARNVA
jgi:hypothetical protein